MKKLINYLTVLTLVLFLSNCDKSTTESDVDPIFGEWEMTEIITTENSQTTTYTSDENYQITMNIKQDNTFSYSIIEPSGSGSGSGSFSSIDEVFEQILYFLYKNYNDDEILVNYSITNDVLTIISSENTDGVIVDMEIKMKKTII